MRISRPYRLLYIAVGAMLCTALAAAATPLSLQEEFDAAVAAVERDELREARKRLQSLLAANPSLHRARLELARVHYLDGDFAAARTEADRVLADPGTPAGVRATVLAFLAQVTADEQRIGERHRWRPSLYAGLMYDSNVNVGPERDIVDIGGLPFLVAPESRQQEDWALVLNPALAHTWNPGRRFEAGEHSGFFLWQSEAAAYYRRYFNENDYDLGVFTLRSGPVWIVPRHWRAWIAGQLDQIWLGNESLALFSSLNPGIAWSVGPATEVALEGQLTQRHYWDGAEDGRDGWYQALRLSASHFIAGPRVALQAGAGLARFNADERRFGHAGPELYAGFTWEAWAGGSVFTRLSYTGYDYDGSEPFFGVGRDDDELRYTLGVNHVIRSGALAGWSLQGTWVYTDNQSNLSLYEYDRHAVNLGLARAF